MGCGQYLCNRKRRKALFFRALPEKIPRGICTDAPFLLTLQSLPFFGSGLGTLTSCDETNRIARNAGRPLFPGLPLVDSAGNGYRKNGKTYNNNGEFDPGSG